MKNLLLLYSLLFFALAPTYAQVEKITIEKTEAHVRIPGTFFFIIPPDTSFKVSKAFTGLENRTLQTGINLTDLPMAYEMVLGMFTKDLPPEGGKVLLDKKLEINGVDARLFKVEAARKSALEKLTDPDKPATSMVTWLVVMGNEKQAYTISGVYKSELDSAFSDKFERTFMNILIDEKAETNPMDGLTFSVDFSDTPFKFSTRLMQTGIMLNLDGKFPTDTADKTFFRVMVMPFPVEEEEQEETALGRVKPAHKEDIEILSQNPIELGGLKGYEFVAKEPTDYGATFHNYSITLFDEGRHYILSGNTKTNVEENMKYFKQIAASFQLQ
ncbi:MAG: hypothetical protein AAFV78_02820 [Bacteroidota bacterium]